MATITGTPGDDSILFGGNDLNGTSGNDELFGLAGDDRLNGKAGDGFLAGGAGNDDLDGDDGNDFLDGGAGNDFLVSATGFGGGLRAGSAISAGQFRLGSSAADTSDRFIYNNNGALFFDVDGVGGAAQVQIATLVGAPTLSAADIVVF